MEKSQKKAIFHFSGEFISKNKKLSQLYRKTKIGYIPYFESKSENFQNDKFSRFEILCFKILISIILLK